MESSEVRRFLIQTIRNLSVFAEGVDELAAGAILGGLAAAMAEDQEARMLDYVGRFCEHRLNERGVTVPPEIGVVN